MNERIRKATGELIASVVEMLERSVDFSQAAADARWNRYQSAKKEARAALAELDAAPAREPVAWRCKDFADGWILFHERRMAEIYQEQTGCLMQALYSIEALCKGEKP